MRSLYEKVPPPYTGYGPTARRFTRLATSSIKTGHSVLFLSYTPARFYLSVELGFIVCFLHFMHICHARHNTLLNSEECALSEKKKKKEEKLFRQITTTRMFMQQNIC